MPSQIACDTCRRKKVRCDELKPGCTYCSIRQLPCNYQQNRRKRLHRRPRSPIRRTTLQWVDDNPEMPDCRPNDDVTSQSDSPLLHSQALTAPQSVLELYNDTQNPPLHPSTLRSSRGDSSPEPSRAAFGAHHGLNSGPDSEPIDLILSGKTINNREITDVSILSNPHDDAYEFIGPSTGISLLSGSGLKWLFERTGDDAGVAALRDFSVDISRNFSLVAPGATSSSSSGSLKSEMVFELAPGTALAREYIDAYFNEGQNLNPLVSQELFENQHSEHIGLFSTRNVAWYSLYNAILAVGCNISNSRNLSTDEPVQFASSEANSGIFYERAISVHAELILYTASLTAVQAFGVMVIYAQHSSTSQCEFKHCSVAVRLALGQGMHMQVLPDSDMSALEKESRYLTFWALYALDKSISLRMGRTSAMVDKDISCPLPSQTIFGYMVNDSRRNTQTELDYFLAIVRYARILSLTYENLFSASALLQPSDKLRYWEQALERDLNQWLSSLTPGKHSNDSPQKTLQASFGRIRSTALLFFYHYGICVIYRRLTLWSQYKHSLTYKSGEAQQGHQIQSLQNKEKAAKCAVASRAMIFLLSNLEIKAHTPSWLSIYYPLTAVMTLFTLILSDPLCPSANSDTALIDVATGQLAKLEFFTSGGMTFTETGELSRLARVAIKKAKIEARNGSVQSGYLSSGNLATQATALAAAGSSRHEAIDNASTNLLHYENLPIGPAVWSPPFVFESCQGPDSRCLYCGGIHECDDGEGPDQWGLLRCPSWNTFIPSLETEGDMQQIDWTSGSGREVGRSEPTKDSEQESILVENSLKIF